MRTILASDSSSTDVPRALRMNLFDRLIMPCRLPDWAASTLPAGPSQCVGCPLAFDLPAWKGWKSVAQRLTWPNSKEKALLASQRAWISYRDAQCELEGFSMRGGTAEPLMVSSCLETLTKQRTEELKRLAADMGN